MTGAQKDCVAFVIDRLDFLVAELAALDALPLEPPAGTLPGPTIYGEGVAYQFGKMQERVVWINAQLEFCASELKALGVHLESSKR